MGNSSTEQFMSEIEKLFLAGRISSREKLTLITDSPDILNKAAENNANGDPIRIIKTSNGLLSVENISYRREYFLNRNLAKETWRKGNLIHRGNDQPAVITYHEFGGVVAKEWFRENKRHRDNGEPATYTYYDNGKPQLVIWYVDGKEYRAGGKPAYMKYHKDGRISEE